MRWASFVWRYLSYRKALLFTVLACALIMAATELSIPWLMKTAIDSVLDQNASIDLNSWLAWTLGVLALLYLAHVVLLWSVANMVLYCSYKFRGRLLAHIHSQALPFFQRHRSGELMYRITSDLKIFETETANLIRELPGELAIVVGVIGLMLVLHVGLGLAVVVFIVAAAAITSYLGQPLPSIRSSTQRVGARLAARFQETIAGVRTVQGFKNERYELAALDQQNREMLDLELREGRIYSLMEPLGDMVELLGLVVLVWYGGHLIIDGTITAGTLVAFIAYMEILARPLGHAEAYFRNAQSSRAVGERLQELLEERDVLPAHGHKVGTGGSPSLVVECVSFRHSGQQRDVVRQVSFAVRSGEVVAIAGRNGAGKSTVLDLLLRFYDPTSGRILADGIDLREWDLDAWRGQAGLMTQEVFLFHGTIRQNIAYGRPEATTLDVERAVTDSGLERILHRFPDGLETVVGERGAQLSGGERQSIALARLFLRKPRLLILDEPTSQLDGEALHVIGRALSSLMQGCTCFMVTHNPETIKLADRVLFLEQGQLVGDGTHEALYNENARYRALWKEQSRQNGWTGKRRRVTSSTAVDAANDGLARRR